MRDRNVKMWMNFSFLDKNVSDNEMDKKNEEYIKSGCGIGEKCEEIYISSIFDLSFPIFLLLLHMKPHENKSILKSATYWVSWDFACKTTKIHFIVHIPCITETSQTQNPLTP